MRDHRHQQVFHAIQFGFARNVTKDRHRAAPRILLDPNGRKAGREGFLAPLKPQARQPTRTDLAAGLLHHGVLIAHGTSAMSVVILLPMISAEDRLNSLDAAGFANVACPD